MNHWIRQANTSNVQYIQDERSNEDSGGNGNGNWISHYYPTEYTPVVPGSMEGTLYIDDTPIQYFVVDYSGKFIFSDIGTPRVVAATGGILNTTGEIEIFWKGSPGRNHCVYCYAVRDG